ncbi:MAG: serine protein kinase PrkA [Sandaracinaceae bacterium]|nr:serine protein kinase PrkA [Sandaracinaceae bacterium]
MSDQTPPPDPATSTRNFLEETSRALRSRFESERRVLSFEEYLSLVRRSPYLLSRDAARYLRDCFDHFGKQTIKRPGGGEVVRYSLFDLGFDSERTEDALVGQEEVQAAFYRALSNFVREGRTNRLILLHGPNGSAKSTFVRCIFRALEHYSETEEGALYSFSWVFPRGREGRPLGFGAQEDTMRAVDSYAHLPEGSIELRLESELRENPLLLLPSRERLAFLEASYKESQEKREPPPRLILEGALGAKNRKIFDALMTAYRGDVRKVLAHVRVERITFSQRYRRGAVTIGPQMAVDASERQITVDRSLAALPASLTSVALYETFGELVDATGGVLEFSDLLKRPLEAWKYLLLAVEQGEVSLSTSILPLNVVFVATSNDVHLRAFREHHEYRSFRGRLTLIRVPYLVDYRAEQMIYDKQIIPHLGRKAAPHATYVAALWAVLTRLRRPKAESYSKWSRKLGSLVASLTPIEKAELYAEGIVPSRFSNEEASEIRTRIEDIRHESDTWANYEGSSGASPREIRTILLDAAQYPDYGHLSPLAVLARIREFCDSEDHEFLRESPDGGYQDHRAFIEVVRNRWLDRIDEELRQATGLVEEVQYVELFDRYVMHVSYWLKKERIPNPITGRDEDPDIRLMERVEQMLGVVRAQEAFRKDLISTIAAYAIDHPDEKVVNARIFPRYIQQLKEATWASRKKQLAEIAEDVLRLVADEPIPTPERKRRAQATLEAMVERFGHTPTSARDALAALLRARYGR